jgi:hypothetical protein
VFDTEPTRTDPNKWAGAHTSATYYSYDIHGNVDVLLQDYNSGIMKSSGNRFKKIMYDYDLISGKVNEVAYQPGEADAFYHRYSYDAENRLTDVETSRDKIIWEKDARYYYYKHGPLARTILGQNQVQGIDYTYTLQGWLKAVNSLTALPKTNNCPSGAAFDELTVNDRSQNGTPNTYTAKTSILFGTGFETTTNDNFETNINPEAGPCDIAGQTLSTTDMGDDGTPNSPVAKDAYSFTLHYFDDTSGKDYVPIGAAEPLITSIPPGFNFSLYNGNIGAMSVNVPKAGDALLYTYHYDQLNRLISMDAFRGWNPNTNSWEPVPIDDYRERVSYDANGNIKTYTRNGDAARTAMDNLAYSYKPNTNQLDRVAETAPDANITEYSKYNDIKQGQTSGNYQYDAIGNLASDASEGISNIDWNVYGKIKSITKTGSNISYSYDASGNRISKDVDGKETWYVRDASGNIMSIYTKDDAINAGHLTQSEISLYGSSRLGVWNMSRDVSDLPAIRSMFK